MMNLSRCTKVTIVQPMNNWLWNRSIGWKQLSPDTNIRRKANWMKMIASRSEGQGEWTARAKTKFVAGAHAWECHESAVAQLKRHTRSQGRVYTWFVVDGNTSRIEWFEQVTTATLNFQITSSSFVLIVFLRRSRVNCCSITSLFSKISKRFQMLERKRLVRLYLIQKRQLQISNQTKCV